jgi:hypothetical protein
MMGVYWSGGDGGGRLPRLLRGGTVAADRASAQRGARFWCIPVLWSGGLRSASSGACLLLPRRGGFQCAAARTRPRATSPTGASRARAEPPVHGTGFPYTGRASRTWAGPPVHGPGLPFAPCARPCWSRPGPAPGPPARTVRERAGRQERYRRAAGPISGAVATQPRACGPFGSPRAPSAEGGAVSAFAFSAPAGLAGPSRAPRIRWAGFRGGPCRIDALRFGHRPPAPHAVSPADRPRHPSHHLERLRSFTAAVTAVKLRRSVSHRPAAESGSSNPRGPRRRSGACCR